MAPRRLIQNAVLVTPEGVSPDAALLIDNGRIAALATADQAGDPFLPDVETIDARGAFVLPGLIDLHTDALEKEITPRPAADFPIDIAVQELDRKFVACGITTVFHSLHFGYQEAEWSSRSRYTRREVVEGVRAMAAEHTLAKTRIHIRFEVVGHGPESRGLVASLLEEGAADLLSFMDHTPGQGQYTRERFVSQRMREGKTEAEALAVLAEKQNRPRLSIEEMRDLAKLARSLGVPIASHDDDTAEKVRQMSDLGVSICEFPVTMVAAQTARALGLHVFGGASNVLRGGSLTGNLDVGDAIRAGAVDGLCSDYYPPSMLHAVFKLWREKVLPLHKAVATTTLVPAIAAGIAGETGSLEVGKDADLIIVRQRGETPVIAQSFVRGERIFSAGREIVREMATA